MAKTNTEVVPVDESDKKPSRKWPILVLAVFLSLFAIAGGLVVSMGTENVMALIVGSEEDVQHAVDDQKSDSDTEPDVEHHGSNTAFIVDPMKEIIVNITAISATGRKSTRFLKMNLAIVFDESVEGAAHIAERKVYIRDAFQNYLRQLTERDISGTIGVVRLKSELLRRARAVTESDAPKEVLISDIIVQ